MTSEQIIGQYAIKLRAREGEIAKQIEMLESERATIGLKLDVCADLLRDIAEVVVAATVPGQPADGVPQPDDPANPYPRYSPPSPTSATPGIRGPVRGHVGNTEATIQRWKKKTLDFLMISATEERPTSLRGIAPNNEPYRSAYREALAGWVAEGGIKSAPAGRGPSGALRYWIPTKGLPAKSKTKEPSSPHPDAKGPTPDLSPVRIIGQDNPARQAARQMPEDREDMHISSAAVKKLVSANGLSPSIIVHVVRRLAVQIPAMTIATELLALPSAIESVAAWFEPQVAFLRVCRNELTREAYCDALLTAIQKAAA